MICYIICAVVGYLIGSMPFGYIIVKLVKDVDVRKVGSGNIGATNVGRIAGWPWGILCFLLDVSKGFFITALAPYIIYDQLYYGLGVPIPEWAQTNCGTCTYLRTQRILGGFLLPYEVIIGLFIILGNLFPIYLRFEGGKGVATAFGVFLIIAPYSTLLALVIWLILIVTFRYVSVASIIAAFSLLISPSYLNQYIWKGKDNEAHIIIVCFIVGTLVILRHIPNIKRLIKGIEPKVRLWKKPQITQINTDENK